MEDNRAQIVKKSITKGEFLKYLRLKVPKFVRHYFVYRCQGDYQFKKSMASFPIGAIFSVIDYAENYPMAPQDEIQVGHWTSTQVTILVRIVYILL